MCDSCALPGLWLEARNSPSPLSQAGYFSHLQLHPTFCGSSWVLKQRQAPHISIMSLLRFETSHPISIPDQGLLPFPSYLLQREQLSPKSEAENFLIICAFVSLLAGLLRKCPKQIRLVFYTASMASLYPPAGDLACSNFLQAWTPW